jgi:hypothetical protein
MGVAEGRSDATPELLPKNTRHLSWKVVTASFGWLLDDRTTVCAAAVPADNH